MALLFFIALIFLGFMLAILNIIQAFCVWEDGWGSRPYHFPFWDDRGLRRFFMFLLALLTLPGAILGFVIGIITFRWIDSFWWIKADQF